MARKKLVHIHSNVLNKMPKPADLNVGELAVNNNVGNEFISLKNTEDEVVRFSSDEQLVEWMNNKEVFPVSGNVDTDLVNNVSSICIKNNQYADSATTGSDIVNSSGVVIDTSVFALSGGNVTFSSVTANAISAITINGKDADSLGNITNITYTPNKEGGEGEDAKNELEFVQSGNNNTIAVNLEFDDELNNTSVNAVQNKVLNGVLEEMEEVTAAALNDLNDRVLELENTPDLHVTGGRFSDGTLFIEQENGPTIEIGGISTGDGADGNNYPSSLTFDCQSNILTLGRNGLSNLTADLSCLDGGNAPTSGAVERGEGAQSGSTFINFYDGATKLFSVNADDLMIDGMIESVTVGMAVPEGETEQVDCLIITWNTDAGSKVTNIPLSRIFDSGNYYTKQEVNNALGDMFFPSSVTSSVTDVIDELELVTSAALNDLNGRVVSISGDVITLNNEVTNINNRVTVLEGDSIVSGNVNGTTLILTKANEDTIEIPGLPTPGSVVKDGVVTGGTINQSGEIKLQRSEGLPDVTITGLTAFDKYVSGGSCSNGTLTLNLANGGGNVVINGVSSNTDDYVKSGEVKSNGDIELKTWSGETANVTGLKSFVDNEIDSKDKYVSGGSFSNGTLTLNLSDGNTVSVHGIATGEGADGNNFVTGGTVDATTGNIELKYNDSAITGSISGLKTFVDNEINAKDSYVSAGTYSNGTITLKLANGNDVTINGVSSNTDDYVESGTVKSNGNIELKMHSGATKSIDGLADYVSSVTQNFITADDDKYVSGGSVDNNGNIILNVKNESNPVTISGLAEYVSSVDNDHFVQNGNVDGTTGDIILNISNNTQATVSGLAEYVSAHTHVEDVWVNESGDTMTGTLKIESASDGETYAFAVSGDVYVSGDVTATGAMYSSDKNLKENIRFISDEDFENAKKIDFKAFNFIANKSSEKFGVIAQDLKENGLGKLTATNDAGYLTVDYISLLCLKIAELEKEIKELKNNKA